MHRIFLGIGVFTTTIVMYAAAGCNNDRPAVTALGPPPPPAIEGTISGRLLVLPNQLLEVEPNETLIQAQDVGQAARLDGVISVSAVGATGARAAYSNYGATVDVAAPGGEFRDADNDDNLDMVLSTLENDRGNYFCRYYQGTSMASPHMAGVVALMLCVNPALTPDDIDMLLAGTHPDTSTRITRDFGRSGRDDFYGHGLIAAAAAVLAANEVAGGGRTNPGPKGSRLSVFPTSLDFRNFLRELPLDISNGGTGTLNVTSVTSDASWLEAAPTPGEAPLTIDVSVDRSGLADGTYSRTIQIQQS